MNSEILLNILQLQIVQIILIAYIGALFGEMKKEVDDHEEVVFSKFIVSWLASGFGGVMVGLMLRGTISKENVYITLGGAGVAGYAGQQKSIGIATRILTMLLNNEEKKKSMRKPSTRKKKPPDNNEQSESEEQTP